MAKELLVTRDLNREMIEAGTALVNKLASVRFNATAVLWLYSEEADTWRIVVGSPDVDKLGPRKVYQQIQAILDDMRDDASGLTLPDISVVGDRSSPIRALRRQATGTGGIREGQVRGTVDHEYIVDSYVYMVKPLEAARKKA